MKAKKDRMDAGWAVVKILAEKCDDDWQAINVLAALMAALCLSHRMSVAVSKETTAELVGHYVRKVSKRAKAAPKKKPTVKKKARK